jgi:alkylation response protein AidB-like acyl-CoA dehydrogenase
MIEKFTFYPGTLPAGCDDLRQRVREFLSRELAGYSPEYLSNSWSAIDRSFSRKLGRAGFLGITLPQKYGGRGLTNLERYVVAEELLYAGAPVGFHWITDRQSAPLILRHGTREQKESILPAICRGEISCCIGMSEPNSGSDLASLQSKAQRNSEGWVINGTKLWTSGAHEASYMVGLFRTDPQADNRHAGLSQFIIDLRNTAGVTVRPIEDLAGHQHFNEVIFEDAQVPADAVLGTEGQGWQQVMEELALERSGPERFLSCMVLFSELIKTAGPNADREVRKCVGRLLGDLICLRNMSLSVATSLVRGEDASLKAVVVKDLGAEFEQRMPALVQQLIEVEPGFGEVTSDLQRVLANLTMIAPSFSLRGGTVEILRGIIARGLGVR